jgi:hypothetical protein
MGIHKLNPVMTNTETVAMIKFGQSCLVNFSSRISIFKKTPPSAAVSAPYVDVVRPIPITVLLSFSSFPFGRSERDSCKINKEPEGNLASERGSATGEHLRTKGRGSSREAEIGESIPKTKEFSQ